MSSSKFSEIPKELTEYCARYLENSDLCVFRLVCRQADIQTKHIVARRFFTTWRTSLMGSDLTKLEDMSMNENLSKYVKNICIEDDSEKTDPNLSFSNPPKEPATASSHIWPRSDTQIVKSNEIGVANLKTMLSEKRFHPETIKVRDYRTENAPSSPAPPTALLKDILDGSNLAVISIRIRQESHSSTDAAVHLCPQNQGQDVGFTMLHSADFSFADNVAVWWAEQLFYNAPILENLKLTFCERWRTQPDSMLSTRNPIFKLKQLELSMSTVPAHTVLSILGNSNDSLVDISFRTMTLKHGATWKELLLSVSSGFSRLASFTLQFLTEEKSGAIKFQGLSKDRVKEEYKPGLEIHERGPKDNKRISWVCYKGPNADEVLRAVALSAVTW